MERPWRLSVDFGSSNTAAAYQRAGSAPSTLPLTHAGALLPSSVFLGPEGFEVGHAALHRAASDPSRFLASPKRLLDAETCTLAGQRIPSTAPVAAVLRRVLVIARERIGGTGPVELVLTHPEAWSAQTVERLVRAAVEAGAPAGRIRTLSEPRAAVLFHSRSQPLSSGERVAVFDYGGGTLDIAVLEAAPDGAPVVVSARGDLASGGRNIDAALWRWIEDHLTDEAPEVLDHLRTAVSTNALHTVDTAVRTAKEVLSETTTATITLPAPEGEYQVLVTRDDLAGILRPEVDRAVELTRATLADAGPGGAVRTLYLTGGSARIPYVQDRLGRVCRVATLDDPKTVVCRGALMPTRPARPTKTTPPGRPPATPKDRGRQRRRSLPWIAAGSLAAVVATVAATIWAATGSESSSGASGGTTAPTTSSSAGPVPGLSSEADAVLPGKLRTALDNCVYAPSQTTPWYTNQLPVSVCTWRDPVSARDVYGPAEVRVSTDPQAIEAITRQIAPGGTAPFGATVLRQASGDSPLVAYAGHLDGGTLVELVAIYPRKQVVVMVHPVLDPTAAEGIAARLGFTP